VLFEKGEDLGPLKIIKLNPHTEPFVRPDGSALSGRRWHRLAATR
jgi:hypothetical protein